MLLKNLPDSARFFIQFGGQGNTYLRELSRLYRDYAELKELFECAFNSINESLESDPLKNSSILQHGLNLKAWLDGENLPPDEYLFTCTVSLTCIFIAQMAYYQLLIGRGAITNAVLDRTVGMTGHSQGIHAAVLASLRSSGSAFYTHFDKFVKYYMFAGFRCQQMCPLRTIASEIIEKARQRDFSRPTPMAAIAGFQRLELQEMVDAYNKSSTPDQAINISLENTPESLILSGCEEDLVAFREQQAENIQNRNGSWSYLEISAPFHSPKMKHGMELFRPDMLRIAFDYRGSQLKIPVFSTYDGVNLQAIDNLGEYLFLLQAARPLVWANSIRPLFENKEITHVIDMGPGLISTLFTREHMQGRNLEIISVATRRGLKKLLGLE